MSSNAVRHVAIVNIDGVDLRETLERRIQIASRFLSHSQIIPQCQFTFRIDTGSEQGALVPDRRNGRLSLFHEGQAEQGTALHGIAESLAAIVGFSNFLKFTNGFFKQTHFTEGDAKVVMRLEILILGAHLAQFRAELLKNFLQWTGFGVDGAVRFSEAL